MADFVAVSADIPWARQLVAQFAAHGRAAEIRAGDALALGGPAAVVFSCERWDAGGRGVAEKLRAEGFAGALVALGRVPPDLDARHRLAVCGACYLPAFTNPEDVVSRVRMILP